MTLLLIRPTESSSTPTPGPWSYDDYFVHVSEYGAVGDYNVSSGAGTDDTAAIQAAIDSTAPGQVNAGKAVLFGRKRYKTTAPLSIPFDNCVLYAPNPIRGAAVGNQSPGWPAIDFHGGATDDCIRTEGGLPPSGSPVRSVSNFHMEGLRIVDRRVSPTGGDGLQLNRTVNHTVVRHCSFHGFPTGASVRVQAQSGSSSDCVDLEHLWVTGSQYGIWAGNIDNQLDIRQIKCDTPAGSPMLAVIRVQNTSCIPRIQSVKHENSTQCVTVEIASVSNGAIVDGIVSRIGNTSGYVVKLDGSASGIHLRGIWRHHSGKLLQVIGANAAQTIDTGTRLESWIGGGSVWRFNQAGLYGDSSTPSTARLGVTGQLYVSGTPNVLAGANNAKMAVRTDSTSAPALTVHQLTGQTSALQSFYDTGGTVLAQVTAAGNVVANQNVQLGGATKTVGFYGSAGTAKPTVTGSWADGSAGASLAAALAALGLLTDSTTP